MCIALLLSTCCNILCIVDPLPLLSTDSWGNRSLLKLNSFAKNCLFILMVLLDDHEFYVMIKLSQKVLLRF